MSVYVVGHFHANTNLPFEGVFRLKSVSWLSDHPTPGRLPAKIRSDCISMAGFVPDHSGGAATVSHRFP
jgi:hypothetical protein